MIDFVINCYQNPKSNLFSRDIYLSQKIFKNNSHIFIKMENITDGSWSWSWGETNISDNPNICESVTNHWLSFLGIYYR